MLLLSGRSGPGRGSPGSGRCGHSWRGRRVSRAVSWKATASASTASMPPATSISRTPNDQPGAPTLTLVTAARLPMCWTAWAATTTVDPRTRRRVGATVLVQDDDGGRGVDGDPENLGVDDPVRVCGGVNRGERVCSTCGAVVPCGEPLRAAVRTVAPNTPPPIAPVSPSPSHRELRKTATPDEIWPGTTDDPVTFVNAFDVRPLPVVAWSPSAREPADSQVRLHPPVSDHHEHNRSSA